MNVIESKKERLYPPGPSCLFPPISHTPEAQDIVMVKEEQIRDVAYSVVVQYFNRLLLQSET